MLRSKRKRNLFRFHSNLSWFIYRIASQKSTRNKQNPRETYFIMKYTEVERFRQVGLPFLSNMS